MLSVGVLASLLINITSSVGVILINKELVFRSAGFSFGTLLTIIHFVVTFGGCLLFAKLEFYKPKKLHLRSVIPISFAFCGYVVFNNLSLLTNSVSVYQISKIFCTPVIVVIEAALYGKHERPATLLSLIPVCIGVFFTVFTNVDLNWDGSFWAALAVLSNSLYTIWGKTKQVELQAKPMQLLLYQAPLSAALLLFAFPFLDNMSLLFNYHVTGTTIGAVALSCVFAFGVNFSFFLFVGKTSPLTVNVVGYLKTALVFVFAFLFTDSVVPLRTLFGVTLTLLGLALYTYAKLQEQKAKADTTGELRGNGDSLPSPLKKTEVIVEGERSTQHQCTSTIV